MKKIVISIVVLLVMLLLTSCGRKYVNIEHYDGTVEKYTYDLDSYNIPVKSLYGKLLLGYYDSNNEKVLDIDGKVVTDKFNYETNLKAVYEDFSYMYFLYENEELTGHFNFLEDDENFAKIKSAILTNPSIKFEVIFDFSVKGTAEDFELRINTGKNKIERVSTYFIDEINNPEYIQYKYKCEVDIQQLARCDFYLSYYWTFDDGFWSQNCFVQKNKIEIILSLE